MIWNITFPQYHPLRDCWVSVESASRETARHAAFELFGRRYGSVYAQTDFEAGYFPGGQVGRTVLASDISPTIDTIAAAAGDEYAQFVEQHESA